MASMAAVAAEPSALKLRWRPGPGRVPLHRRAFALGGATAIDPKRRVGIHADEDHVEKI